MKKLGSSLTVAVFGALMLNAQSTTAPNARLVIRSGIVEVQRAGMWLPISLGESLNPGERVRTASGSTAALEIGEGNVITLNEQSAVKIGPLDQTTSPLVQLENGSMKVFSASDIQVAAKDMTLESAGQPVDLELGFQADQLNLTVFDGAVRNGAMIIHGRNQDPSVRTYSANGRFTWRNDNRAGHPAFYIYPYFLYGNPDPNAGAIVPPVVTNPTNPGYRPTQIVPPMSDPIRVPVTRPSVPARGR